MGGPVARRLAQLSAGLGELDRVMVTTAGEVIVKAMTDQLVRDTGGDQAMSGFRGGRYRMTLKLTPLANPVGVRIRPAPRQSGMWTILDSGAKGHTIAAKPRRKRKAKGRVAARAGSRRAAVNIGGAWRAGPVHHPGARGHRTWSKGRDAGLDAAVAAVRDAFHQAVTRG